MDKASKITALNQWYKNPLGTALLKAESLGLADVLPQIFGYYIIQAGGPTENNELLATSRINNHIYLNPGSNISNHDSLVVHCNLDELPFLPESIDAAVMFHLLEFAENPKSILKEIYMTLVPNGYAVIIGFNPYSLWGIAPLWKKSKEIPWLAHWISPGSMRQWLSKIGFSIGDYKTFYFRPPSDNPEKSLFLEGIGPIFWPYCGASYMFVAQKVVTGVTPIKTPSAFEKCFKPIRAIPKPTSRAIQ